MPKSFKDFNTLTEIQETLTGYAGVISSDHAYIHRGLGKSVVIDLGSISASTKIGFTTPDVASGKVMHWRPIGLSSSANYLEFDMTEDDTFTGGTDITGNIFTRNRGIADSTDVQAMATGVTSTPTGLVVQGGGIGSEGKNASRSGGSGGADEEIILAANTSYVINIVPAGATIVRFTLFWYEEDVYSE